MLLIGVDCATEDNKIGLAAGEYETGSVHVRKVTVCAQERPAALTIAEWLYERAPALLAFDAPLGWPEALGRSLMAHRAGETITISPNDMFRRATDRFIQKHLRKTPLDVGADRIARTAHAALRLLGDLRERLRAPIPLAWAPTSTDGLVAIEVYPAATLRGHGLRSNGYRTPQ
jgi:predicted RNase H-like nuclease